MALSTGDPWLDEFLRQREQSSVDGGGADGIAPAAPSQLPPPVSNPYLDAAVASIGGGEGGGGGASPDEPGLLRTAWNTVTSPIHAVTGVSGSSLVHLLGIPELFPEAYEKAKRENALGVTHGVDRPLSAYEEAQALPGFGDVITAEWDPDTLVGRIARPITKLGLNIAGDPLTYVGPGLAKLTKVGAAADAVKAAALGADAARTAAAGLTGAEAASTLARADELTRSIPTLTRALETARAAESPLARTARAGLEAVAFPYTPMGGLAYAPEMIESTIGSAKDAYESARAGRYQDAAASGVGALMTAALGSLVAKGVVHEAKAASVLERAIGDSIGDDAAKGAAGGLGAPVPPPEVPPPAAAPDPGAGVPPAPPVAVPPTAPPPPVPGAGVAPPAAPSIEAPISTAPQRVNFDPATQADLHAKQQQLLEMIQAVPEGGKLPSIEALRRAGILSQSKKWTMQSALEKYGLNDIAARLQGTKGKNFTLRPESVEGEVGVPAAPTAAPAGGSAPAEGAQPAGGPPPVVPPAPQGSVAPEAPAPEGAIATAPEGVTTQVPPPASAAPPAKLTRVEIDRQLENPELRTAVNQALEGIAGEGGVHALTPDDVRTAFPGDANKHTRALLNRSLEAIKKTKRVADEAAATTEAAPAVAPEGAAPAPVPTPALTEAAQAVPRSRQQPAPDEVAPSVPQPEAATAPAAAPTGPERISRSAALEILRSRGDADYAALTDAQINKRLEGSGFEVSDITAEPTHKGQYPKKLREPNLDMMAERLTTSGPGAAPPTVESARVRAIQYAQENGIDLRQFDAAGEKLLGKPMAEATPGEFQQLINYIERHPDEFGVKRPAPLNEEAMALASKRLMGDTEHLNYNAKERRKDKGGRDFFYDPQSPAGNVQKNVKGTAMEDALQDTLTRWLSILSGKDNRNPKLARTLERLMTMPDEAAARKELTKLLQKKLKFQEKTASRTSKRRESIAAKVGEGLSAEERARFADTPDQPMPAVEESAPVLDALPERPEGVDPKEYRKTVLNDSELLRTYRLHLAEIAQQWSEGKSTGKARTGLAGEAAPWMAQARQMADQLGMKYDPRRGTDRLMKGLNRILSGKAQGSKIGDLLTDAMVAERAPQYRGQLERGAALGDTGARVADIENDAASLVKPLAEVHAGAADELSRVVDEIGQHAGLPAKFGGIIGSPKLSALKLGDDVLVNLPHQYHRAVAEVSPGLKGGARNDALAYLTARNTVDDIAHEITHKKARHDAATGDVSFREAYADVMADLRPHYGDLIRRVQSVLEPSMPRYESEIGRLYKEAIDGVARAGRAGDGNVAGTGARRIAPIPNRPGGGQGGAPGRVGSGAGPARAVPGGAAEPTGGVRAGAPTVEGAADAGGAGAGRGVETADASLTGPANVVSGITKSIRDRAVRAELEKVGRAFLADAARWAGHPIQNADELLDLIKNIDKLPAGVQANLKNAGPQRKFDIALNLSRIAPEAMSEVQRKMVAAVMWLNNQKHPRGEPMTFDKIDAGMRQLLNTHTPEEFVKLKERTGLSDPYDFAAIRAIHATFSQGVDEALNGLREAEIRGDNDAITKAREEFSTAWAKRAAVEGVLTPETTNVAKIMSSLRMMAHPLTAEETFKSRFFGAMRAAKIKTEKAEQLYSMMQDTMKQGSAGDWTTFTNAFREATRAKGFDKFLEFWKAGLLGWTTQAANTSSNALFFGLRNAEHAATVLADAGQSALTGAPRQRHISEIGSRINGLKQALRDAMPTLKEDLWDIVKLNPPDISKRLREGSFYDEPDIRRLYGAIEGKKGEFVRIPFKLLDVADNFFKHISRTQEFAAQADRLARDAKLRTPGESVQHASSRIFGELRRISQDPFSNVGLYERPGYKAALEAGRKAATEDTFQSSLGPVMRKLDQAAQAHPALELLFPFRKTPYNILAEGMKRTPLGAMWAISKYKKGEIQNPEFVHSMVKSAIGTLIMGGVTSAALDGTITGGGPADPKQRELLKRTGWQPYSFKLPGANGKMQYYSYQRIEPFATILGLASDMGEAWKNKDVDTPPELMQKAVASLTENLGNKSFLTGLEALTKILSDPQHSGLSALKQLEASLVPNVVGVVPVAHAARAMDPKYRETEALSASPLIASIPGLSQTLPEQKTPTGEARTRTGSPLERLLSPIAHSEERTDPIADAAREISRLGVSVTPPPLYTRVGNSKIYFTEGERDEMAAAQNRAMEKIAQVIGGSRYQNLQDQEELARPGVMTKSRLIRDILAKYRNPVRTRIDRQAVSREREKL